MADKKISALTSASAPLAGTEVLPIVQSGATVKVSVDNLTAGKNVTASRVTAGTLVANADLVGLTQNSVMLDSSSGASRILAVGTAGVAGTLGIVVLGSNGSPYIPALNIDAAGNVTISTTNLVVGTAAKGINFTANTPAAGMTSELLNWYEEGTFTPTVQGSSSAGTGTYNAATGVYTRIGNLVTVQVYMNISAHTGTGNIEFGGLPFTSATTAGIYGSVTIGYLENCTVPATSQVLAFISPNTTFAGLYSIPSTGGAMTPVAMDTSFSVMYSATYRVA